MNASTQHQSITAAAEPTQHEQRCANVAACLYYLAESMSLAWDEITATINIAMVMLDRGYSGATTYEFCAKALKTGTIH